MPAFSLSTTARCQMVNIDRDVARLVADSGIRDGVATIYCSHTTAGITVNENADPDVCRDWLENLNRLVPANQPYYRHAEGNSDGHVKSSLVGVSVQIPVEDGALRLGVWQSIYFCEFDGPRERSVWVGVVPLG